MMIARDCHMEKIWLKSYESTVPETINPDEYSSLVELIEECFAKFASKPGYMHRGKALTYQQINDLSQAFAGFLQHTCRLSKGDRVVIMLPNILQYPVAMFGALRAGM